MHRLFLVVLLAALNAAAPSQEFAAPIKPDSKPLSEINRQLLFAPLHSAPPRFTFLDSFTPAECIFVDAFDCVSRDLSGVDAADCGRVRLGRDPRNANDCVIRAFNHRKPFRVRYDEQGVDSLAARGVVMTPSSKLIEVGWSSDTWNPSTPGFVGQRYCIQPSRLRTTSEGELECIPVFRQISDDIWLKLTGTISVNAAVWK